MCPTYVIANIFTYEIGVPSFLCWVDTFQDHHQFADSVQIWYNTCSYSTCNSYCNIYIYIIVFWVYCTFAEINTAEGEVDDSTCQLFYLAA